MQKSYVGIALATLLGFFLILGAPVASALLFADRAPPPSAITTHERLAEIAREIRILREYVRQAEKECEAHTKQHEQQKP